MKFLADELLLDIFQYLPSKDRRKSARLVCRQWNRISQDRTFSQQERILVNSRHRFQEVLTCLEASARGTYNLWFQYQDFGQTLQHPFWEARGARVGSLVFDQCVLTLDQLGRIVDGCPKVRHVSLICTSLESSQALLWHSNWQLQFTAKSVVSFALQFDVDRWQNLTFEKMTKLLHSFPNLVQLKIALANWDNRSTASLCTSSYPATNNCISYQQFVDTFLRPSTEVPKSPVEAVGDYVRSRSGKLKNLWLMLPALFSAQQTFDFSQVLHELRNLEELRLRNSDVDLSKLPNLRVLNLALPDSDCREAEDTLNHIMDTASNLEVLQFETVSKIKFCQPLVVKLLSSKLKRLHIKCCCVRGHRDLELGGLPENRTLEELVIFGQEHGRLSPKFFPCLKNLQYLALSYPTNADLRNVFKHLVHLRSLILEKCENCSIFDSNSGLENKYSFGCLKELEYLRINEMNMEYEEITTLSSFILPKLKRLEIYVYKNRFGIEHNPSFIANLIRVIGRSRDLEAVELRVPTPILGTQFKQLLDPLKKIRYFSIAFNSSVPIEANLDYTLVHQLLEACPDLQHLKYSSQNFSRHKIQVSDCDPKPIELIPKWAKSDHEDIPQLVTGFQHLIFD